MGIVDSNKPGQGDAMHKEHAAVPAGALEGGLYVAAPSSAPNNPTLGAVGSISASVTYKYTFAIRNPITDQILGETTPSAASGSVTAAGDKVNVTGIAASSNPHVNCRRIYRDDDAGGTWYLVKTLYDNTTNSFTDNTASTTGQPSAPTANTTGQAVTIDVPDATDAAFVLREAGTVKHQMDSEGKLRVGDALTETASVLGAMDADLTETGPNNTTVETSLYSYTIPASAMGATGGFRVTMGGLANYGVGTHAATLRAKLGATTALASGAWVPPGGTNSEFKWWWEIICMNSTVSAQRWITKFGATYISGASFEIGPTETSGVLGTGYGTSAEATSADLVLDCTAQLSNTGDLFYCETALLEIIKPV